MADNMKSAGAQDRALISLEQEHKVRYRTGVLGVSVPQLHTIVTEVGYSSDAVRARLAQ